MSQLIGHINGTTEADTWFLISFIVLVYTTMIHSNVGSPVNHKVLSVLESPKDFEIYNWCEHVIDVLDESIDLWKKNKAANFTGPICFLTILYVDRVTSTFSNVPRNIIPFFGWTFKNLKLREESEIQDGGFGKGQLLGPFLDKGKGKLVEEVVDDEQDQRADDDDEPENEQEDEESDHEPAEEKTKRQKQTFFSENRIEVLKKIAQQVSALKAKYETEVELAKKEQPEKIEEIQNLRVEFFASLVDRDNRESPVRSPSPINFDASPVRCDLDQSVLQIAKQVVEDIQPEKNAEKDPENDAEKDAEKDTEMDAQKKSPVQSDLDQSVPQISKQVVKDIQTEKDAEKPPQKKSTRLKFPTEVFKSPFHLRETDIVSKVTKSETDLYTWVTTVKDDETRYT